RPPRSIRRTTSIYGYICAASARMAGVASVEPSSTMIHRVGKTVCAATVAMVVGRYAASSRQGVISTYRLEGCSALGSCFQIIDASFQSQVHLVSPAPLQEHEQRPDSRPVNAR